MVSQDENIVVVGAGCFGISTAYHLLKRGFTNVTVLDRSPVLPAPDAASTDINKVVRSSYSDPFYTNLARDAIACWKDRETWGDTYHESGVLVLGFTNKDLTYADESYKNELASGARVKVLPDEEAVRAVFPAQVLTGSFVHTGAYLSSDGGWANARQGVSMMIKQVVSLGGKVIAGKKVNKIAPGTESSARRVECDDGSFYDASLVIIAAGSWTPSTFANLATQHTFGLATGQCIAMIQLNEEEIKQFQNCPIILDFGAGSGFYIFPPNETGIVKMATHVAGYTHTGANGISSPRTVLSDPEGGLLIPKSHLQQLRQHLRDVYPTLAEKPFAATRICWYNDTPDGDWIISRHPVDPSIVVGTGGSGHAYKFLPVIGTLVADVVQGKMDPTLTAKFALDRRHTTGDPSREGMFPVELPLNDLCTPEDLLP